MKKTLLASIALCCLPALVFAAQTPVTPMGAFPNPAAASINTLKAATNTKLEAIEGNRQDHETRVAAMETGKAPVSCFADSAAFNACFAIDWPTGFDTAGNYTVTGAWDFTGATVTGISGIGGISHATSDGKWYGSKDGTWADLGLTFIKTADMVEFSATSPLSYNPTTGALSMVTHAYQAYDANMVAWPVAVSATEISYLDGATSNLQTQINAISAGGFVPTYVTTDPTTASTAGLYVNTTTGHMFIVGSTGMVDVAGTWTAAAVVDPLAYSVDLESGAVPAGTSTSGTVSVSSSSPLAGSYSALLASTAYLYNTTNLTAALEQTTQRFLWRKNENPGSASALVVGYSTSGELYRVTHNTDGTLSVSSSEINPVSTASAIGNGDYKVWVTFDRATNGTATLYIDSAAATSRPSTPAATTSRGIGVSLGVSAWRFYSGGLSTLIDNLSASDNLTLN